MTKQVHHMNGMLIFLNMQKKKIKIFSSPFDEDALILLEKLNCPIYKIASFEMTDLNLIKQVAKNEKTNDYLYWYGFY